MRGAAPKQSEKQLKLVKEQVTQTEKQIENAIKEPGRRADEHLQKSLKLLCSIPGIGLVTAVALILATNNFTAFSDSGKFASYCGVAPFEHTSGTSIRGRTKTSHLANKRIARRTVKALLSNGAASAIQSDVELKIYFHRKVAEAVPRREKPKMVVINAIRAKLINRVFATINPGTEYVVLRQHGQAA